MDITTAAIYLAYTKRAVNGTATEIIFSFQEIRARCTEPFIQRRSRCGTFVNDQSQPIRIRPGGHTWRSIVENVIVRTSTITIATHTANGRRSRLEDILIRHRRRRLQAWTYLTAAAAIVAALWAF